MIFFNLLRNKQKETTALKETTVNVDEDRNQPKDEDGAQSGKGKGEEGQKKPKDGEGNAYEADSLPDGNSVPEGTLSGKRPSSPGYSVVDSNGKLTDYGKWYYERPSWKNKTIEDVWSNAQNSEGKVYDRQSRQEIPWDRNNPRGEQWHMGHKEGYEFAKHQQSAGERGITVQEFRNEYNTATHIEPELPASNLSHQGEAPKGTYYGF